MKILDSQASKILMEISVMRTLLRATVICCWMALSQLLRGWTGAFCPIWSWMLSLLVFQNGVIIAEDCAALLTLALIPPIETSSFVMLQLRCVNPLAPLRYLDNTVVWGFQLISSSASPCEISRHWSSPLSVVYAVLTCPTLKNKKGKLTSMVYELVILTSLSGLPWVGFLGTCLLTVCIIQRRKVLTVKEWERVWQARPCRFLCHSTLLNF